MHWKHTEGERGYYLIQGELTLLTLGEREGTWIVGWTEFRLYADIGPGDVESAKKMAEGWLLVKIEKKLKDLWALKLDVQTFSRR